ncbi:MAG: hypothetical protein LBE56_08160, partial [Tannerella sp.]|nr:hypothetical protein [Tannerella sp.]
RAGKENVETVYKTVVFAVEGHARNEKNTLATIQELAPNNKTVSDFIIAGSASIDKATVAIIESLQHYAEARAGKALKVTLSKEELAASKIYPVQTSKPIEMRYGALNKAFESMSAEQRNESRSLTYTADIARMTDSGANNVLDIQKMIIAQYGKTLPIADITKFLNALEKAGYVRMVNQ